MRFNTALLRGDFRGDKKTGATQTPVYQSSAFEHASAETLEKIFNNKAPGFSYSRISNPTVEFTTMSAPYSIGFIRYAVATVLSMISGTPALCAASERSLISVTSSLGFPIVSAKYNLVLSFVAASNCSILLFST